MFNTFDNLGGGSARASGNSPVLDPAADLTARRKARALHGPTFRKTFRWQPSDPRAPIPAAVELAGSFTDWQLQTMKRDAITNTWQLTLDGIPGHCTHRYMLFVNGEPAHDKNCDGLAVPQSAEEERHQLMTARGPRVFLLFAQTK